MQLAEKEELVRLLNLYQADLIRDNSENIKKLAEYPGERWKANCKLGVKAQYEHARIIAKKLSVEIGRELKSDWEL